MHQAACEDADNLGKGTASKRNYKIEKKKEKRKVYASQRPRALREGPLTSRLGFRNVTKAKGLVSSTKTKAACIERRFPDYHADLGSLKGPQT
eukprot:1155150-Pelagomonas_calceolata.AAC.13